MMVGSKKPSKRHVRGRTRPKRWRTRNFGTLDVSPSNLCFISGADIQSGGLVGLYLSGRNVGSGLSFRGRTCARGRATASATFWILSRELGHDMLMEGTFDDRCYCRLLYCQTASHHVVFRAHGIGTTGLQYRRCQPIQNELSNRV